MAATSTERKPWTEADDAVVRQYANGRNGSWGKCAADLGRSVVSVRSRAARLGVERALPEISDDQIRELHAMGVTTGQAGRILGVSDENIRMRQRALGLESQRYSEAWRSSELRKARASTLVEIKRRKHAALSAALGWPSLRFNLALTMHALERLGVADKRDVAGERVKVCEELNWRICSGAECVAISMLLTLECHGYIVRLRKKRLYDRMQFRLRRGIKTMPDSERLAIVAVLRQVREEFDELADQHRSIVREVREKYTKRREVQHVG